MQLKFYSFFIIMFIAQCVFSQGPEKHSIFHRLVIIDEQDALMVVKLKNTNFWVTPGIYQTKDESIHECLENLAETYGIKNSKPKLRGIINLNIRSVNVLSVRNVFIIKIIKDSIVKPKIIDEIEWLPLDQALQKITFPHIRFMIDHIMNNPNGIWTANIERFDESGLPKARMLQPFIKM